MKRVVACALALCLTVCLFAGTASAAAREPISKFTIPLADNVNLIEMTHAGGTFTDPEDVLQQHVLTYTPSRKVRSIGGPVTIAAMLVDALVNYSFLSGILLTNGALLIITVLCMSVASDGCMWGLAEMLNRKDEKFTTKPLFWTICGFLGGLFLLSVVASVMIRFGSMDVTYGTINADGEFVGKASYSLAEYGITLISAFVTTATGVLSFAFSLDKNAFKISIRDRKKGELAACVTELAPLENELALLENAPDVREWDDEKRAAAEHQIEALRVGLKLHCRKLLTEQVNDADFTEEMAESGKAVLPKEATESADDITPAAVHLDKVS